MSGNVLRLGIVGCGYGTQVLAPAFLADPRVQLVAIAGRNLEKVKARAEDLGVEKFYADWVDMLDEAGLDALAVAVPPKSQPEILSNAIARNLAVFAEKPLALTFDEARSLAAQARISNLANVVDFNFSEIAHFLSAKTILDSGTLGEIYHVAVTWQVESYANRMGIQSWKTDEGSGGGALSNFISHSFHYLEWLLGPIAALSSTASGMPNDMRQNDVFVSMALRFRNGAAGGLIMSAAAYQGSGHRIEIYGKEGVLSLENPGADYMRGFQLRSARRPDSLKLVNVPLLDEDRWHDGRVLPASRLARRFTDWATGGSACEPSFVSGLRVQRLLGAARQSAKLGVWIDTL
jgi:predicted dehydrogenase